jgi:hypothetical protein
MARYLVKQEVSIAYDDYASTDNGNWGPTTVTSPNATTQVLVRTTADGIWQLKQTVGQIKAGAASAGSVKITMALKNLSTIGRNVTLLWQPQRRLSRPIRKTIRFPPSRKFFCFREPTRRPFPRQHSAPAAAMATFATSLVQINRLTLWPSMPPGA